MTTDEEIQQQLALMDELFGAKGPNGNVAIPLKTKPGFQAYYSHGTERRGKLAFVRVEPYNEEAFRFQK